MGGLRRGSWAGGGEWLEPEYRPPVQYGQSDPPGRRRVLSGPLGPALRMERCVAAGLDLFKNGLYCGRLLSPAPPRPSLVP